MGRAPTLPSFFLPHPGRSERRHGRPAVECRAGCGHRILREGSRSAGTFETDILRQVVAVQRRRRMNRLALLPWIDEASRRLSPVQASSRLLSHLRRRLEPRARRDQRERAARTAIRRPDRPGVVQRRSARTDRAGGARRRPPPPSPLLEEPLAALYAWIAAHPRRPMATLGEGVLLVRDVGGGRGLQPAPGECRGRQSGIRTDCDRRTPAARWRQPRNLALAVLVEQKLPGGSERLSLSRATGAPTKMQHGKRAVAGRSGPDSVPVTILAAGAAWSAAAPASR